MKQIAIQGALGSYHDIAAHQYFENEALDLVCCDSFDELFDKMKHDKTLLGLVAIENTIAGSLLHNNDLLRFSNTRIVGEHKLHISHSLAALPGTKLEDIEEIHSHPIALQQCREFFQKLPNTKIVESEDTALSAKVIKDHGAKNRAAVCSAYAAELYGLEVLQQGIETNKANYTRFLVIADKQKAAQIIQESHPNKANIVFTLPHEEGSLSQVLSLLSFYKNNLTKIQSLPVQGEEWRYQFYVDLTFDDISRYHQSLTAVMPLTKELKVLGEYEASTESGSYQDVKK